MDKKRVLTSTIYFIIVLSIILINNKILTTTFALTISLIAIYEYFNCIDKKGSVYQYLGYILSVSFFLYLCLKDANLLKNTTLDMLIVGLFVLLNIISFSKFDKIKTIDMGMALYGYIYTIYLPSYILRISFLDKGNILLALLFIIVMATDAWAYIIGKWFGKHKLTKISPKKTKEGAVGGIVAAIIFTIAYQFVVNTYFDINFNTTKLYISVLVFSIIAQIGDLTASIIKRNYNKKDFGNILPGHGGILDRVDGLIFTAPFLYYILPVIIM